MGSGRVQQGLENRAVVFISGRDFYRQRDALAIDHHVALGARFTPIGRVGAGGLPAPFGCHAAVVERGSNRYGRVGQAN
jgi:hypothetical protein